MAKLIPPHPNSSKEHKKEYYRMVQQQTTLQIIAVAVGVVFIGFMLVVMALNGML